MKGWVRTCLTLTSWPGWLRSPPDPTGHGLSRAALSFPLVLMYAGAQHHQRLLAGVLRSSPEEPASNTLRWPDKTIPRGALRNAPALIRCIRVHNVALSVSEHRPGPKHGCRDDSDGQQGARRDKDGADGKHI